MARERAKRITCSSDWEGGGRIPQLMFNQIPFLLRYLVSHDCPRTLDTSSSEHAFNAGTTCG